MKKSLGFPAKVGALLLVKGCFRSSLKVCVTLLTNASSSRKLRAPSVWSSCRMSFAVKLLCTDTVKPRSHGVGVGLRRRAAVRLQEAEEVCSTDGLEELNEEQVVLQQTFLFQPQEQLFRIRDLRFLLTTSRHKKQRDATSEDSSSSSMRDSFSRSIADPRDTPPGTGSSAPCHQRGGDIGDKQRVQKGK
ncbi:hypothetical protein EYF80_041581 [Liparis tanakae]|uniref:Uncharacterized protein n=1 Tax=Liparis tanakae TaxID=230148 RepID=A0A4Z2G6Q1_9TELE|nr:hypothetical protein EYF80_041581 [Liparis tanakae]